MGSLLLLALEVAAAELVRAGLATVVARRSHCQLTLALLQLRELALAAGVEEHVPQDQLHPAEVNRHHGEGQGGRSLSVIAAASLIADVTMTSQTSLVFRRTAVRT